MTFKAVNLKKRIAIGTGSAILFYTLLFSLTGYSAAQQILPITPPTTPPVTPPSVTLTATPTPEEEDGHATGGVTAQFGGKTMKVAFNAHGGEEVKGNVNYTDNFGDDFKGDVDVCYEQSGNTAVFVGTIDQGDTNDEYFYVEVQDNGEGSKSTPDKIRVKTFLAAPSCTFSGVIPGKVMKGNLQVH